LVMLVPRLATITYFSGRKGGTGKSTIAIALSMALKTNTVLIDFGIDSTQTLSRLLGINPDRPGALDFMLGLVKDVNQVLVRSNVVPSVFVIPPGSLKSWDLWGSSISVNQAFNALRNLVITACSSYRRASRSPGICGANRSTWVRSTTPSGT